MNTQFNGYCNYETEYIAEVMFDGHTPDMYNNFSGTVKGLADSMSEYAITQIESTSFSGGMAREIAFRLLEEVDFEEIADRIMEDA